MPLPRTRRRRRTQQSERADGLTTPEPIAATSGPVSLIDLLPSELTHLIERHLGFVDRLAFATACGAAPRRLLERPGAPWLLIQYKAPETAATLFSPAARCTVAVRSPDPAMRGHAVSMGSSSGGWFATADARGVLRLANPATTEQAELPAITTIPFVRLLHSDRLAFCVDSLAFMRTRFRGGPSSSSPITDDQILRLIWSRTWTMLAGQMRMWFYRKVVLSVPGAGGASPPRPGSYTAMIILDMSHGFPAFASAEDPVWRPAPSHGRIEDAVHHNGQFYSVTYAGAVEAWERDGATGEFTSREVAPRLPRYCQHQHRTYLAAAPDGRLMAVLMDTKQVEQQWSYCRWSTTCVFKVLVLDEGLGQWQESTDIGEAALFVDEISSTCVSTREHPGLRAGRVYFTKEKRAGSVPSWELGVYNLRDGWVEKVSELSELQCWPRPVWWFTPSCSTAACES